MKEIHLFLIDHNKTKHWKLLLLKYKTKYIYHKQNEFYYITNLYVHE